MNKIQIIKENFSFTEIAILASYMLLRKILNAYNLGRKKYNKYSQLLEYNRKEFKINSNESYFTFKDKRFTIRKNTSDYDVLSQVFLNEEYSLFKKIKYQDKITCIDLGANVGFTSLYIKSLFPDSKIICVEPDPENYAILIKNLSAFSDTIKFKQAAIWSSSGKTLSLCDDFRDGLSWSRRVKENEKLNSNCNTVESTTLNDIYSLVEVEKIDVLKIDIEGAEFELFDHFTTIEHVILNSYCIAIEIHNEIGNKMNIIQPLLNCGFEIIENQQTTFAFNKN